MPRLPSLQGVLRYFELMIQLKIRQLKKNEHDGKYRHTREEREEELRGKGRDMKSIKDGLKYDTEKAELIASWESSPDVQYRSQG